MLIAVRGRMSPVQKPDRTRQIFRPFNRHWFGARTIGQISGRTSSGHQSIIFFFFGDDLPAPDIETAFNSELKWTRYPSDSRKWPDTRQEISRRPNDSAYITSENNRKPICIQLWLGCNRISHEITSPPSSTEFPPFCLNLELLQHIYLYRIYCHWSGKHFKKLNVLGVIQRQTCVI